MLQGLLLFFVVTTVLLGVFSKRSALEILDWRPTRSPEVEAANEIDDVEQMIAAQNEIRARLGSTVLQCSDEYYVTAGERVPDGPLESGSVVGIHVAFNADQRHSAHRPGR